jgi:hypothetical protein
MRPFCTAGTRFKPADQVVRLPDLQEQSMNWYNTTVDVDLDDAFSYPKHRG